MKLKSKQVTVGDDVFEVREIAVGDILPILPKLNDPEQASGAQTDIIKLSVFIDGKCLGDDVMHMGVTTYLKLAEAVLEINGLMDVGKS